MASVYRLSVALMSPEHAERKRTQDRINQRYSRARKKSRIEELESRNQTLIEKLASAEAEIARLQDREAAVRHVLGNTSDGSATQEGSTQEYTTFYPGQSSHYERPKLTLGGLAWYAEPSQPRLPSTNSRTAHLSPRLAPNSSNRDICSTLDPQGPIAPVLCNSSAQPESDSPTPVPIVQWGANYDILVHVDICGRYQSTRFDNSSHFRTLPIHKAIPAMPGEMIWMINSTRKDMTCSSTSQSEASKSFSPTIPSLLNDHEQEDSRNASSDVISARLRPTRVTSFVARVALQVLASLLLNWYANPNSTTFQRLPQFLRPTSCQTTMPHQPWIDMFCWPEGRDAIIRQLKNAHAEDFWASFASSVRLQWPHSEADIFVLSAHGERTLSPMFLSHVRDCQVKSCHPLHI